MCLLLFVSVFVEYCSVVGGWQSGGGGFIFSTHTLTPQSKCTNLPLSAWKRIQMQPNFVEMFMILAIDCPDHYLHSLHPRSVFCTQHTVSSYVRLSAIIPPYIGYTCQSKSAWAMKINSACTAIMRMCHHACRFGGWSRELMRLWWEKIVTVFPSTAEGRRAPTDWRLLERWKMIFFF